MDGIDSEHDRSLDLFGQFSDHTQLWFPTLQIITSKMQLIHPKSCGLPSENIKKENTIL